MKTAAATRKTQTAKTKPRKSTSLEKSRAIRLPLTPQHVEFTVSYEITGAADDTRTAALLTEAVKTHGTITEIKRKGTKVTQLFSFEWRLSALKGWMNVQDVFSELRGGFAFDCKGNGFLDGWCVTAGEVIDYLLVFSDPDDKAMTANGKVPCIWGYHSGTIEFNDADCECYEYTDL